MKTFEEILKEGNEGYSFRDILDNLTDEEIIECANMFANQVKKNAVSGVVSESFSDIGRILLSKDVTIEKNLDGCSRFVINGKMLHHTKKLYETLKE